MGSHGLIVYAIVFLAASVLAVPLSKKWGLGSVLGYLIAGILIGPTFLSLVQGSADMAHYAELGVVFLLFIIGLELQPKKLWSLRSQLLGFGLGQIFFTTAALFLILQMIPDLTWQAAAVSGFALALSSTAFGLQSLIEKAELKTHYGQTIFAVLLTQDLVAIPALAVIPLLATTQGAAAQYDVLKLLSVFGFILFLIVSSRTWLGPLFRWIASTRSREIFTATTLLLVLSVSYAMQSLGVSMGLGAFIAGVLLADSEYRHEIEVDLEPFKALLMGFFFISVGITVPFDHLLQNPLSTLLWVTALMLVKFTVMFVVSKFCKQKNSNAKKVALYLALGGEFAFVISSMGLQLGILDFQLSQSLNLVVTLSMLLTPLILYLDSWVSLKIQKRANQSLEFDKIESQDPQVIVAGFGRFGQTFGRIFRAQGIPFTAVDHDPSQIELLRKFGSKVYYGDCSREEILEAAGGKTAKVLVLAIDDPELSMTTARMVQKNFPHLKVYARARNRQHAFELLDLGFDHIKREVFDSSLNFVGEVLVELGYTTKLANKIVERFRVHDEILLREQFKHKDDEKNLISVSQQAVEQLEQVLRDDTHQSFVSSNNGPEAINP